MCSSQRLDLVRLTGSELSTLLENGELTSVDLVKQTLAQIHKHNRQGLSLRALISVAPEDVVVAAAARLDAERKQGQVRGPFHGLPILVKDSILTHANLGMPTTVGSTALLTAKAKVSAKVVDELIEKGMIVIGKTNLNEWASWKSMGPMNGWSAAGGQTNSTYVRGGLEKGDGAMGHTNPCGASTGSAVGVSAGFSPISIGTEVDGSLVQPAARAALYALKPTVGSTELAGVYAVSEDFDSVGAMAKSTKDLAIMTEYLLKEIVRAKLSNDGFVGFLQKDFSDLKIGFVDPAIWRWPESIQPQHGDSAEEMKLAYLEAIHRVDSHKGKTVYPVTLPPVSAYMLDGSSAIVLAIRHVFKQNTEKFLELFETSEVWTVEDVIRLNSETSGVELPADFPEQDRLIDTLNNPIGPEKYAEAMKLCRPTARDQGVDLVMSEYGHDLIAFPMDSPAPRVAAAAGYPIATMPLGSLSYNHRPFGLAIIVQSGREDLIFRFMSAFEAVSRPRDVPGDLAE